MKGLVDLEFLFSYREMGRRIRRPAMPFQDSDDEACGATTGLHAFAAGGNECLGSFGL